MKKTLLIIFLSLATLGALAAPAKPSAAKSRKITVEKPDFKLIERVTHDPSSEFYYPKLITAFNRNDTSMTKEQYRNLYLGYLFQEDYDPYRSSPYNAKSDSVLTLVTALNGRIKTVTDSLNRLVKANTISGHEAELQKGRLETLYKRELRELSTLVELSLKDNPFDLRQMSVLVHASKEMGNNMKAKIWEYRLENLLGAIKSTGTGENMDNAFYVIYPMHEYNMIQLLGYEPTAVDFPAEGFDYISVRPEEGSKRRIKNPSEGFYFNVVNMSEQYELKHPGEDDDATLQVQGTDDFIDPDDVPALDSDDEEAIDPDEIPAE
ncbi:MAG: DUF4919 domain-containing protein [Bacteroides sp.]|nr:DUF4919 domain-containing protein [Bacteroides sp.]